MLARFKNLGYNRPAPPKNGVEIGVSVESAAKAATGKFAAFCFAAPFMVAHSRSRKVRQLLLRRFTGTPTRLGCRPDWRRGGSCQTTEPMEAKMASATLPQITGRVTVSNGKITTTTQDIAEVYGKRHDRVMAAVRQRIAEAGEWGVHNFVETTYTNPQNGQIYPVIRMTKKGFHFVVGKFTGTKAVAHQIAFADEFERMEQDLTNKSPPLRNRRQLLSYDETGAVQVQEVPFDACVMNRQQFIKALFEGNSFPLPTEELTEIIFKANGALASRARYFESKAIANRQGVAV